jgi:predicted O-linked N-acetylglucosamine transferase (SPINDLY family)
MRARLEAAFDDFLDARHLTDAEIAHALRQREIDVVVDLKGHTNEGRPGILAFRPAPVQAQYMGYPGTMGAEYIDYIIADKVVIPDNERRFYREHVAYLPDTYYCYDATIQSAPAPERHAVGLPQDGFVFCCFNNANKILPEIFDLWMGILREVENSVLWLADVHRTATSNLRSEAEARGVPQERLIFAPFAPPQEHLARLSLADLFLDTLPYNAHTTAVDALWMGVPVLTLPGTTFVGRVAASVLGAVGLPEMIAKSADHYQRMALQLARNRGMLSAIKAKLMRNRSTHPLFDTARFTRNLEAAYLEMMRRQRDGLPPESFTVG